MSKYKRLAIVAGAFGLICLTLVPARSAHAAPNQGPDPADFVQSTRWGNSYPGVARTVDYAVATSAFNTILQTKVKIYLPASSGQVVVHNQNICYNTFKNGGRNYDQLDDGTINSSGNVVSFQIGSLAPAWGAFDSAANCDTKTLNFNVTGGVLDPNTGMYPFLLTVSANPATDKYMNTFWVTGPAGAYVSQDSSQSTSSFGMNQTSPIPSGDNPSGTQSPPDPYRNYSNWSIRFAPDCTVTTPTVNRRIEIFDDDNRNNWDVQPRPFYVKLFEYDRSGVFQGAVTPTFTFPDGVGGATHVGNDYYEVWTGVSGKRIWINYTFKRDMIYNWFVDSVYYDNTLQFKIPFDNVFYYRACQTTDYNLSPSVNVAINGGAVAGNIAEPGDNITFTYAVNNTGPTASPSIGCTVYGRTYTGNHVIGTPPNSTSDPGYPQPSHGCPRVFPANTNTTLTSETVTAPANSSVCRSLFVDQATASATAPSGVEVCAYVASKPYSRVLGGDVSVGGAIATAPGVCTRDSNAAVIGWNKRSSGGYAGAGVQFAAYALSTIFDTATSHNNGGGAAAMPTGLSFANTTTNAAAGQFGGNYGTVPCRTDYYGQMPTGLPAGSSNIGQMATGSYVLNGPTTLNGTIGSAFGGAPQRVVLYVNGDVMIDNNIRYPAGSWTAGNLPFFQLVARGNIYIDNDVTDISGLFIAQENGANGGQIHTCATTANGYAPLPFTTLHSDCDQKLTVNGALIAKQVRLLRTIGTLRQSAAGEASSSANIAEVFNFSPALWLSQPTTGNTTDYDAINSLPPIL